MKPELQEHLKKLLGDQWDRYETCLTEKPFRGFRVNTLKCSPKDFFETFVWPKKPTPFASDTFYMDTEDGIGNTLPHALGLIYSQEPSACAPVTCLDVQEGMTVLDLCAAPGSKATQIAQKLNHTGFLVANEINSQRALTLLSNFERCGVSEALILNDDPIRVAQEMEGCFDRVLLDAPCSGEGMFRKEPYALEQWTWGLVESCAKTQAQLLEAAYKACKKGGRIVYSTCTFTLEENEAQIIQLLNTHDDVQLVTIKETLGEPGCSVNGRDMSSCRRIYPMNQGEGQFMAVLEKTDGPTYTLAPRQSIVYPKAFQDFVQAYMPGFKGQIMVHNGKIQSTQCMPIATQCHVLRQGVLLGEIKKERFVPHQHLFTSVYEPLFQNKLELTSQEIRSFREGLSVFREAPKGYVSLHAKGYPLGFGKSDGNQIKNLYPKGLRIAQGRQPCD